MCDRCDDYLCVIVFRDGDDHGRGPIFASFLPAIIRFIAPQEGVADDLTGRGTFRDVQGSGVVLGVLDSLEDVVGKLADHEVLAFALLQQAVFRELPG